MIVLLLTILMMTTTEPAVAPTATAAARADGCIITLDAAQPVHVLADPARYQVLMDDDTAIAPMEVLVASDRRRVFIGLADVPAAAPITVRFRGGAGFDEWAVETDIDARDPSFDAGPDFIPRVAPTVRTPAPHATVLFNGVTNTFTTRRGATWPVENDAMVVDRAAGDVFSEPKFEDLHLHVEWNAPPGGDRQNAGNSGVKVMRRYEVQILNTGPEITSPKANEAGAIYAVAPPSQNASRGAGKWQSYDIFFTAPRWRDEEKTADARMTVYWNGVLVHDDVVLKRGTGGAPPAEAPGPDQVLLQAHSSSAEGDVQFRNVWAAIPPRLAGDDTPTPREITGTTGAQITPFSPRVGGGPVTRFLVHPALPTGLRCDPRSGVISGVPQTGPSRTTHQLVAMNTAGQSRQTLILNIRAAD